MRNSEFNCLQIKTKCENKLDIEFRDAGEYNGWFWLDGRKHKRITIPKGRDIVPKGTYKSMAEQLNITVPQFDDLLSCPLKKEGYITLQREKLGREGK
jgi:hypothetical protein